LVRLAILALLLTLVGVVVAGSLLRRPTPPFGLAGNGVLAIANPEAILIADADGSNQRVLVDAKEGVESLIWSPDGTKLAFRSLSPISRKPAVMVVDRDGTNLVDVTRGFAIGGYDEAPSWSPDGRRLVIPSPGVGGELVLASADGSGARSIELAGGPRAVVAVAWSPDGGWISFVGTEVGSGAMAVHRIRPEGTGEKLIARVASDSNGGPPQWAPDPTVRKLVFVAPDASIQVYDLAAGRFDRLSASGGWPSWSPDASQVAWWDSGIVIGDVAELVAGGASRQLIAASASCTDPRQAASSTPCGPPTWSPDGKWIFAPDISTKAVVALSVDGSQPPIKIVLPQGTELNPIGSAAWQRVASSWWPWSP
jgi:Tol biopolymer transport system component